VERKHTHPTILGTDTSQGKGQIISNISACQAVQATIKSTLGPYGGDLLMIDENGRQTITNDGATVMKVNDTHAGVKRYAHTD
jgi:T-complex protein 1 subunit eta